MVRFWYILSALIEVNLVLSTKRAILQQHLPQHRQNQEMA